MAAIVTPIYDLRCPSLFNLADIVLPGADQGVDFVAGTPFLAWLIQFAFKVLNNIEMDQIVLISHQRTNWTENCVLNMTDSMHRQ